MSDSISRRRFVNRSLGVGAGAAILGKLPVVGAATETPAADAIDSALRTGLSTATTPLIITSHSNETGQAAMGAAWEILSAGGSALDAVEKGANVIEVDPEDTSVGYGGLPNERGVVQLDASIMDGRTYSAGSVASLEGIKTPASVARLVMERTDHVMLVGPGALEFAKSWGFEETDLLTEKARQRWLRWREGRSDRDDWGPPDHIIPPEAAEQGGGGSGGDQPKELAFQRVEAILHRYGTTNVLAVDANGDIAGITTTSGLAFKIPGRIGDSPIIGAGLYVDNDVGAAGATGRGEDVIKSCASYYIVMRMRDGMSPQEACEDAMGMILHKYRNVNPEFVPSEKFVAINKAGEYGCARMPFRDVKPRMSVRNAAGLEIYEGTVIGT
jgi:N4-(beta-N-acetylglucosaminyl)-L-asparaginase